MNAWDDGTFVVGQDIQVGRYRTDDAPEDAVFQFCMASRQRLDGTPSGMPESTTPGRPTSLCAQATDRCRSPGHAPGPAWAAESRDSAPRWPGPPAWAEDHVVGKDQD